VEIRDRPFTESRPRRSAEPLSTLARGTPHVMMTGIKACSTAPNALPVEQARRCVQRTAWWGHGRVG
jgi:hypothetical protein